MAVNRFSRRQKFNTFNPLSIEELALVPAAKQHQHDTALAQAQQQGINIQALGDVDKSRANELTTDVDSRIDSFTNNLMNVGVQADTVRNFMDLKSFRDDIVGPRGEGSRIQGNFDAFQTYKGTLDKQLEAFYSSGGKKGIDPNAYNSAIATSLGRFKGTAQGDFSGYQPGTVVNESEIALNYAKTINKNELQTTTGWRLDENFQGSGQPMWVKGTQTSATPPPDVRLAIENYVMNDPLVKKKRQDNLIYQTELQGINPEQALLNEQNRITAAISPAIFQAFSGQKVGYNEDIKTIGGGASGRGGYSRHGVGITENRGATVNPLEGFNATTAANKVSELMAAGDVAGAERLQSFIDRETLKYTESIPEEDKKTFTRLTGLITGDKAKALQAEHDKRNAGKIKIKEGEPFTDNSYYALTADELLWAQGVSVKDRKTFLGYNNGLNEALSSGKFTENKVYNFTTENETARGNLNANLISSINPQNFKLVGVEKGEAQVKGFEDIRGADKVMVNNITSKGENGKPSISVSYIPNGGGDMETVEIELSELRTGKIANSAENFIDYLIDPLNPQTRELNQQIKNEIRFNSVPIGKNNNLIDKNIFGFEELEKTYDRVTVTRANDGSYNVNYFERGQKEGISAKGFETKEEALQGLLNVNSQLEVENAKLRDQSISGIAEKNKTRGNSTQTAPKGKENTPSPTIKENTPAPVVGPTGYIDTGVAKDIPFEDGIYSPKYTGNTAQDIIKFEEALEVAKVGEYVLDINGVVHIKNA